jgi:hypothetical protein
MNGIAPIYSDFYAEQQQGTGAKIKKTFAVKEEVREALKKTRVDLIASRKVDPATGMIADKKAWEKVDKKERMAAVAMLLADVCNGRPVHNQDYPVPSLLAALAVDTDDLVDTFQKTISVIAAPMQFGRMLLKERNHEANNMSLSGRSYTKLAESYIFEQKKSGQSSKEVYAMQEYAEYDIEQRAIEVRMDRFDLSILPWDEFGTQMRMIAEGAARTENMVAYKAFFDAYGSGTRPYPNLENVGGEDESELVTINSSTTSPYTDITRTAGDIIYYDYLYARRNILSRPNAVDLMYIVVTPVQWERMEYWNASQKIAFARVMGRSGVWQPTPGFDGRVIPCVVLVDDDLGLSDFQVSSKYIALYVGPGEYVGDFVVKEETKIFTDFDQSKNTDIITARQSNDAVINNYNSWVFQYNLLTSY